MKKSIFAVFLIVAVCAVGGLAQTKRRTVRKTTTPTKRATIVKKTVVKPIRIKQEGVTTASGLKYIDLVEGKGESPNVGQQVTVHYTGRLEDGTKFDSSLDRDEAFTFTIGVGQVIRGWDEGVITMKVGGKRRLIIPSDLAYGPSGRPPVIPPNAELIFDVELVEVDGEAVVSGGSPSDLKFELSSGVQVLRMPYNLYLQCLHSYVQQFRRAALEH